MLQSNKKENEKWEYQNKLSFLELNSKTRLDWTRLTWDDLTSLTRLAT